MDLGFDALYPVGKLHPFTYLNTDPKYECGSLHEEVWAFLWIDTCMLVCDEKLSPWTVRLARKQTASCLLVQRVAHALAQTLRDERYREYLHDELHVDECPQSDTRRFIDPIGPWRAQIRDLVRKGWQH